MEATDIRTETPVRRHYAVWHGPRWNFIDECRIAERDPAKYIMDPSADYFRFYDRFELDWEVDGQITKLRSDQFNFSPFYLPGGQFLTDEERAAAFNGAWRSI